MEKLIINGTDDTPTIHLDSDGLMYISGRSLPEDVISYYKPVFEWLNDYMEEPYDDIIFKVKLEYFNTATSKILVDIFILFEELADDGYNILIEWYYPSDDEDVKEAGEEYEDIVDINFKLISYEYDEVLDFEK